MILHNLGQFKLKIFDSSVKANLKNIVGKTKYSNFNYYLIFSTLLSLNSLSFDIDFTQIS